MNKCVIFDRDGTLSDIVTREDGTVGAPWKFSDFKIKPEAVDIVRWLKVRGFKCYVASNQPDIFDERFERGALGRMHDLLFQETGINEIMFASHRDSFYYKPNTGMISKLCDMNNVDRNRSFMVGDSWRDVVAGHRAGLNTIFIDWQGTNQYTPPEDYKLIRPTYFAVDLIHAYEIIREHDTHVQRTNIL